MNYRPTLRGRYNPYPLLFLKRECIIDLYLCMTQHTENIFLELKAKVGPEVIGNVNLGKYRLIMDMTYQIHITINFY